MPRRIIHAHLAVVYGDDSPAYESVVKLRRQFQSGRPIPNDEDRSALLLLYDEPYILMHKELIFSFSACKLFLFNMCGFYYFM